MAQLSDPLLEGHIAFSPDTVLHLCTMFLHFIGGGEAALIGQLSARSHIALP